MKKYIKRRKRFTTPLFLILILCTILFFSLMELLFLPVLKEISHTNCKSAANKIIDEATIHQLSLLDPAALLSEKNGSFIANTALINLFCSGLSQEITSKLYQLEKEKIYIPFGAATNLSFLANSGPKIPFTLVPMGNTEVDYQTELEAAGINQIHYKIWIDISIDIQVVTPLYHESIRMNRKYMLADLIYGGQVPEHYVHLSGSGEYLLTE